MKKFRFNLPATVFSLVALFLCILGTSGAQAQSVLFIGNSYTYGHFGVQTQPMGGVPELFARIAQQDGHSPEVKMVAPGGTTMHQHFDNGAGEITAIQSKKWDYVVLQGHSLDATTSAPHPGEFLEYGQKMAAIIRQNNPATKIVLYETWAYPKAHQVFPAKFANQSEMLDQIAAGYRTLGEVIKATAIAPVGDAFFQAANCPRHYDVYAPKNDHHSNDTGYMLSALVFARSIYGELPVNLNPILTDVSAEDMEWLASIADGNVRAWEHARSPAM
jgi:hypothetical protein